ncbi:MAG: ABC transporter substrate-binding protein [Gemmatimonadaceae bacterium]
MTLRRFLVSLLSLLVLATAGCADTDPETGRGEPGGTVVIASAGDADFLLPPLITGVTGKQVVDQLYEKLAEIGPDLNTVGDDGFTPRLAESWEWADDSLSITFQLDPEARWHDGRPVRAGDVRFSHRFYTDSAVASAAATRLSSVDSVTIPDSVTAVVWFARRSPEQFFDFVYELLVLPEHVLGGIPAAELRSSPVAREPVGSGPFRFVRWEPGVRIEIVADTGFHRGRPSLDRVIWRISSDPSTAVTQLLTGAADFYEVIPPPAIPEIAADSMLQLIQYPALAYGYLAFNFRDPDNLRRPHPLFSHVGVRRALSMAVDREALVASVFDSLGRVARGPFASALVRESEMPRQIPFDPAAAATLLDSLGWRDANGDGIRERNGTTLAFDMLVPTSSRIRMSMAVLLQEQLRRVGARVELETVEFTTFLARQAGKQFDAALGAWNLDPSFSGLRQNWMTEGQEGTGTSNFGSYSGAGFDALVDSALVAPTPGERSRLKAAAFQAIVDDAPAIWLYEPLLVAAAHRRIDITGMRPDAWWAGIPEWSIAADRRIARDSIGLRARPD